MVQVLESTRPGRRKRNHEARRQQYLRTAMEIVSANGAERLTMARMADDLDCAVGTIYTYFDSKDALLAELQRLATERFIGSYRLLIQRVDPALHDLTDDEVDIALARLLLGLRFWVATAEVYPDESQLFRSLITRRHVMAPKEVAHVVPSAWEFFALGTITMQQATDAGAISPGNAGQRMVTAVAALGGVLLVSGLSAFDAELFSGSSLAWSLIDDIVRGWGADPDRLIRATALADTLAREGPLVPLVPGVEAG